MDFSFDPNFLKQTGLPEKPGLLIPSRSIVLQMGFAGRHWDWKMYYKAHTNNSYNFKTEAGAIGTAFIYYF